MKLTLTFVVVAAVCAHGSLLNRLKGIPKESDYNQDSKFTNIANNAASKLKGKHLRGTFDYYSYGWQEGSTNLEEVRIQDTVVEIKEAKFMKVTGADGRKDTYVKGILQLGPMDISGNVYYNQRFGSKAHKESFRTGATYLFNVEMKVAESGSIEVLSVEETDGGDIFQIEIGCSQSRGSTCLSARQFIDNHLEVSFPKNLQEELHSLIA